MIRGGALALAGVLAVAACAGTTEDDGGDGSGGAPTDGSGGAGPGSGGAVPGTGGTGGTAPGTGGALGGGGGALGGAGGAGDVCSLPFSIGNCDALIPVYFHNAATDRCEPATYGGCGGNANRFETFAECESACDVVPTGAACEVDGVVYPNGWTMVPDPISCNTCTCTDGQLGSCTEAACPDLCPEGTLLETECTACAPNDACEVVHTGCLPTCDGQPDCAESGGFCSVGVCRMVCG